MFLFIWQNYIFFNGIEIKNNDPNLKKCDWSSYLLKKNDVITMFLVTSKVVSYNKNNDKTNDWRSKGDNNNNNDRRSKVNINKKG